MCSLSYRNGPLALMSPTCSRSTTTPADQKPGNGPITVGEKSRLPLFEVGGREKLCVRSIELV